MQAGAAVCDINAVIKQHRHGSWQRPTAACPQTALYAIAARYRTCRPCHVCKKTVNVNAQLASECFLSESDCYIRTWPLIFLHCGTGSPVWMHQLPLGVSRVRGMSR